MRSGDYVTGAKGSTCTGVTDVWPGDTCHYSSLSYTRTHTHANTALRLHGL